MTNPPKQSSEELKAEAPLEEVWRVADLIGNAEVATRGGNRSVRYYISVGLDHFGISALHEHSGALQGLLNAAAEAVIVDARPTPVLGDVEELVARLRAPESRSSTMIVMDDGLHDPLKLEAADAITMLKGSAK